MDVVGGIVAYVIVWVVVLFMVLPFGVRQPDETEPGHMPGAPDNPRIGLKFAITSAIAAVLWVVVYVAVDYGWIGFPAVN